MADALNARVDTAHGLRVEGLKGSEHCVIVGCVIACLAKDLEKNFSIKMSFHMIIVPSCGSQILEDICQALLQGNHQNDFS